MTVRAFWPRADGLTRAAAVTAVITASINLATYAGLTSLGAGQLLYAFHVVVMVLFGAVFLRGYRDAAHSFEITNGTFHAGVPVWLIVAIVIAVVYAVWVFNFAASQFGEGSPQVVAGS